MNEIDNFLGVVDREEAELQLDTLCCGLGSGLWRASAFAAHDASAGDRQRLLKGLQRLQSQLEGLGGQRRDRSLDARLRGLVLALAGVLGRDAGALRQAAEAFEAAWSGDQPTIRQMKAPPAQPFGFDLPLDRLGGWLVYDVLWHLQHSKPGQTAQSGDGLEAREETPFLVVSAGSKYVLRVVAELLPGPPGLITPDWWPMGLIAFSQPQADASESDRDRYANIVASTQGLLTAVAEKSRDVRLRWRLEERRVGEKPWSLPIAGRSGEAAVACLGHAVYERHLHGGEAILNPSVVITATVQNDHQDIRRRGLGTVNAETISGKFQAAAEAGLREVLVAAGQLPDPLPPHPSSTRVATLADAIMEISATNQYVRAYRGWVRGQFDAEWVEVDTPREEAPK